MSLQVGIIQSIESLNKTKVWGKYNFDFFLGWDIHLLWPSDICVPGSQAFRLILTHIDLLVLGPWVWTGATPRISWASSCRQQIPGSLSLHNHVSQPFIITLFMCILANIPLVLFPRDHGLILILVPRVVLEEYKFKDEFSGLVLEFLELAL